MINFEELKIPTPEITKDHWNDTMSDIQTHFSGNVGLGTNNAEAKLHVQGIGGGNVDLLVNGRIKSDNVSGGLWVGDDRFIGGHSTNKVGFYSNKTWRLTVQNNGNVGIGTTSPTARLQVHGGGNTSVDLLVNGRIKSNNNNGGLWIAGNRFVGGLSTNKLGLFNNGSWRLTVLNNGNVGIATTSPTTRLHVNGTFKAGSTTVSTLKAGSTTVSSLKVGYTTVGSTSLYVGQNKTNNKDENATLYVRGRIYATNLRYFDKKNMQYNNSTGEFGYDNSTRRAKRNITPLQDNFGKVLQLLPRTYTRPQDPKSQEIGYIAEEAKSLGLDNLVYLDEDNHPDGVNYRKLCLYLVEVVREHERKLNPNSPYLKKHVEDDLPKPTIKSDVKNIKHYLDFYRISYNNKDSKKTLLKKVENMD